ncbi:hypothetical protein GUITHDRAFT_112680 [Guillardia theta CCMP2712]|uniref:RWP-RK domain-containing protein n=1 Tax=Guillardia theta (strain CCMP2712) TaxID=905079 RepID=L1IY55_GUITC|nr:hypothetical protein GUITHDRAFT_112680 [Guillardia theta CCMP2712]EKX41208.1 hypothetical protein GUITHDRAFT_112680 [Guillardia theta CCMP2712]|eukprot:XP_005828188.1 hypothetical protein GUITHDRAFT_112680 [Guillardia theta CCMP2712]
MAHELVNGLMLDDQVHPQETVSVVVRSRPRDSDRRDDIQLTRQVVESFFGLRQIDAAKQLGVSLSSLKAACRKLGIEKWPYSRERADRQGSMSEESIEREEEEASTTTTAAVSVAAIENGNEPSLDPGWISWYVRQPLDAICTTEGDG